MNTSAVSDKRRKFHQMSMALVTVQRSPSVTGSPPQCGSEGETEEDDANKSEKSECFFASKATAMGLTLKDIPTPRNSERRGSTDSVKSTNSIQSNSSDIQQHLQSMIDLLNPEETLKMAVKLESQRPNRTRYLVIVSRCCYRATTTTDRKHKITRHNSTKTRTLSETSMINIIPMRQTSADGSLQQQQLSQTELSSGGGEMPLTTTDAQEKQQMSNVILATPPPQRQSLRSDNEKISASGDSKAAAGIEEEEGGIEESCLLGIDCNERTTIGLVLPILADTTIHLDGDGGFSVSVYSKTHIFKPVSVQAMWSALQTLHKVSHKARENNFYPRGPSHDWTSFYDSRIESEQSCLNEWNAMDSIESRRPPSPDAIRNKPTAKEETEGVIKMKLKEIMMSVDLDEVTSKYIRGRLEELLDMDLGEFKSFIDEEMLIILGQMDAPTEIFEHVYLGSEWNASNLEELQKNGIRHILNVTREIDNFFPGVFDYFNVRVYDDEKTNLLKHWDNTFRYITRAKSEGSKVLVHCKMGVSRSASVVIAYAMKAYNWEFKHALQHVKERRSCIKPNKNFLNQLETYRGMLDAMKNKEKLQRSKSETNLKSTKDARLLPGSEPTPLIQALNQSKSQTSRPSHSHNDDASCCGDNITAVCVAVAVAAGAHDEGGPNKSVILGRSKGLAGRASGTGNDSGGAVGASEHKQRRLVRRSSSTSPLAVPHVPLITAAMKQQSQSLENLTPERSVAEEPKNVRFPGSNGENYSVTQNQVRHIQKNVQPPPPPPPPPPASNLQKQSKQQMQQQLQQKKQRQQQQQLQIAYVRTRVLDLETTTQAKHTRKTADDRRSLNLQFGRSVSHDTGTSGAARDEALLAAAACYGGDAVLQHKNEHSPVWTSSAKLITQTSNLKGSGTVSGDVGGGTDNISSVDAAAKSHIEPKDQDNQQQQLATDASRRHSRKTHSWTAASGGTSEQRCGGGIVLDRVNVLGGGGGGDGIIGTSGSSSCATSKLGSNSSIDSISSTCASAPTSAAADRRSDEQRVITRIHRHRDLPSRHASWGSGDTRCALPTRNSSWAAYDSNRNSFHYGGIGVCGAGGGGAGGAIIEGQIHELNTTNKSNKTVTPQSIYQSIAGSPQYQHRQQQQQQQQHVGTVKRTKQKLEQCTTGSVGGGVGVGFGGGGGGGALKKLCPENCDCPTDETTHMDSTTSNSIKRHAKGATNLFRSASAAGSMRARVSPYRCNSVEIVPGSGSATSIAIGGNTGQLEPEALACHLVMRRSEGSRPLHNELFSASSVPDTYTMSDIENKNTLPAPSMQSAQAQAAAGGLDEDDETVVLRGGGATSATDQRISGSVQILKKNFEAKAGSNSAASASASNANVLQIQTVGAPNKKGHHSLPSSPVAQHVDPHYHHPHHHHQQLHHTHSPQSIATLDVGSRTASGNATAQPTSSSSSAITPTTMYEDELSAEMSPNNTNTLTIEGGPHATTTPAAVLSVSSASSQPPPPPATSSSSSSASASSSSSTSSSLSSSASMCETYNDRNVKVLVHKYQTPSSVMGGNPSVTLTESATTTVAIGVPASSGTSLTKPRRHSYYESGGGQAAHKAAVAGGLIGVGSGGKNLVGVGTTGRLTHEYNDSRPPPAPAKSGVTHARDAVGDNTQQQQQQQQQHQQRRLQQHGRTHPLSRLTLPKQSFNAAAYNTM